MIEKILVVDDSPIARKMLKSRIPKDKNYEIFIAVNGQDAVEKYQEIKPDVTFMDLTMPVMDGYEALTEIKKIDRQAIVIVITADIQPKSIASVMEKGAFTLLKKPVKQDSVTEILEKAEIEIKKHRGD